MSNDRCVPQIVQSAPGLRINAGVQYRCVLPTHWDRPCAIEWWPRSEDVLAVLADLAATERRLYELYRDAAPDALPRRGSPTGRLDPRDDPPIQSIPPRYAVGGEVTGGTFGTELGDDVVRCDCPSCRHRRGDRWR